MEELSIFEGDLFDKLPIDLIYQVIRFLPYASAATTRELCKKSRELWDRVLVRNGKVKDLSASLASFLGHIDDCDPIKYPWNLFYQFGTKSFLFASVVGDWQLRLNFSMLKEKSISMFHLSLKPTSEPSPRPNNFSFYVKTLHLRSVSYLTNSIVSSLVTNFTFLEKLHIEECKGLHSLHISAPELKELSIFECSQLSTLHLDTPKLECFRYIGPRPWILAKGVEKYKLRDVMLDFRQGARSKYLGCSPSLLLSSLMNVSHATICACSYQEVIALGIHLKSEKLKLSQLKELCWIERVVDGQSIQVLLSFLNLSPNLEKLFIIIDAKSYKFQGMAKHVHESTHGAKLANLKAVKIEGCNDERDEILLLESLSYNAAIKIDEVLA